MPTRLSPGFPLPPPLHVTDLRAVQGYYSSYGSGSRASPNSRYTLFVDNVSSMTPKYDSTPCGVLCSSELPSVRVYGAQRVCECVFPVRSCPQPCSALKWRLFSSAVRGPAPD